MAAVGVLILADDPHDGVRWWLQQFADLPHPVVTLSGYDGMAYVLASTELPGACQVTVQAWIKATLAQRRADRARRAGPI